MYIRTGHIEKCPASMALIHVDGTGKKAEQCNYCTMSCLLVILYVLMAWVGLLFICSAGGGGVAVGGSGV